MPSSERHLTLYVPGLFSPPGGADAAALLDGLDLSALERILARADGCEGAGVGFEAGLLGLFGVAAPIDSDPPVAALSRFLDTGEPDRHWMWRADPVHVRAALDRLVLVDTFATSLPLMEARALVAELNVLFAGEGMKLECLAPGRWYLISSRPARLRTHTVTEALGNRLDKLLPYGDDAGHWRSLFNEAQMVLHASEVNRRREELGRPAVNSLWFWGGGRLPPAPERIWDQVWGGEATMGGLARLTGTQAAALPGGGRDWLDRAPVPGRHLLVVDALLRPAARADLDSWREALQALSQNWLEPLAAAVAQAQLASLALDGGVRGYRATRSGLRRFWRWRKPLANLMREVGSGGE